MIEHSTRWAVAALVLLSFRALAQNGASADAPAQQNPPPAPAYGQANPSVMTGQNPPISALDAPSLEPNLQPRSMLVGGVVASEALDTNIDDTAGSDSVHSVTRLLGGLAMQRLWERYNFAAAYVGGVGFYPNASPVTRQIQELQAQQSVLWKTGQASLRDSFSYLPEGSFGAGAYGGASGFQLGLGGLDQSIGLSGGALGGGYGVIGASQFGSLGQTPRITNVTVADIVQQLGPRSALTAAGSFGLVHFTGGNPFGFVNSNQFSGEVGYSHALNPRSQVGVEYAYRGFRYPDLGSAGVAGVNTHIFQALYGYRITGRMDLLVGAGPQWTFISGQPNDLTASARASLRYRFERASAELSYLRINTAGSGFFAGAESDIVRVSGTYDIARRWHARVDAGYSHHDRLQTIAQTSATPGVNAASFDYVFGGGAIEREFNRNLGAFISYQYNAQIFGGLTCTPSVNSQACNNQTSRQVVQFGASWHFRPIRLD
jgi:hypothetical protein